MGELDGRVALITGGGSGIGLGVASALVDAGCKVALMGRTVARVREAASGLGTDRALGVEGDVADEAAVAQAVERTVARFGRLDIGVNAAGTGHAGAVVDTRIEDWSATLRTNLDGTFLSVKYQARAMAESGGGSIVNVSSIAGVLTHRLMSAYCVSKAGVEMLTKCAADELGAQQIRVNAIRPGLVPTELASSLVENEAIRRNYESLMPLGRLGTTEEVAAAVLFLVSDRASWITGQVFGVDGGHTLRAGPDIALGFT